MIKLNLKTLLPFAIILLATFIVLNTFRNPGVPATHDSNNHLARMANFYIVVKDLQIPPRWAPNLNYEYGYPVFHYNYYLGYIPTTFFYLLTGSFELSYKIIIFFALYISGFSVYLFLRKYASQLSSLVGAILFIAAPPQLLQIFVRGSFGATIGWMMFAVCMLITQKFIESFQQKSLGKQNFIWFVISALSIFSLILSHNVIFLFGLPFIFLYGLVEILQTKSINHKTVIFKYLLSIFIGLGLGAYFWLPALLEVNLVTLPSVALSQRFFDHMVYFRQFLYSSWGYGYSEIGTQDTMSFMLGFIQWGTIFIGLLIPIHQLLLFKKNIKSKDSKTPKEKAHKIIYLELIGNFKAIFTNKKNSTINITIYFIFTFITSIFFMTPVSKLFWQLVPFLQKTQFPWRLLFLSSYSMAILGGLIVEKIHLLKEDKTSLKKTECKTVRTLFSTIIIIFALTQAIHFARPKSYLHQNKYAYLQFPFTSSTQHENLPVGFDMPKVAEHKEKLFDINGYAQFNILEWKSNSHIYSIESTQSSHIVEHLAAFPGWHTYINGQEINPDTTEKDFPGVITYQIEPGSYQVETKFKESTSVRKIGDIISIISIIILFSFTLFSFKTQQKEK